MAAPGTAMAGQDTPPRPFTPLLSLNPWQYYRTKNLFLDVLSADNIELRNTRGLSPLLDTAHCLTGAALELNRKSGGAALRPLTHPRDEGERERVRARAFDLRGRIPLFATHRFGHMTRYLGQHIPSISEFGFESRDLLLPQPLLLTPR